MQHRVTAKEKRSSQRRHGPFHEKLKKFKYVTSISHAFQDSASLLTLKNWSYTSHDMLEQRLPTRHVKTWKFGLAAAVPVSNAS